MGFIFWIKIFIEAMLASALGVVYSVITKKDLKGFSGKLIFIYLVILTISIILVGFIAWKVLGDVNILINK